jgi:energy-coupling factor transporter ATP-binding protein EcfA2
VETLVRLGRTPHRAAGGHDADVRAVEAALARMELGGFRHRPATQLSGGEQARVLIARALAQQAPLMLADEPIAGLDPAHQLAAMEVFAGLAAEGRAVVAALHDLGLAARYCSRLVLMHGGRVVADGLPGTVLTPETGSSCTSPFPRPRCFRGPAAAPPARARLADFNLIGFQTARDVENFTRYMVAQHGAEVLEDGRIRSSDLSCACRRLSHRHRPRRGGAHGRGDEARARPPRLGRIIENRALVIGVDRMDYSKGLPQRLAGLRPASGRERGPARPGELLQIAPPSRETVEAYRDLREELDAWPAG